MNRDEQPFEQQAQQPSPGFFAEFVYFIKHNKKWWLTPLLLLLLLLAGLVIFGGSAAAPFIYSLF